MKIPDSIKIIGHTIKIIFKKKVFLHGKEVAGIASYNNNRIELATTSDKGTVTVCNARLMEVLLHECLHFIDDAMHLKLSEHQILCLTRGILSLIRDNKLKF